MSDRSWTTPDPALAQRLKDLGAFVSLPPTPDIASAVVARLGARSSAASLQQPLARPRPRIGWAFALAIVALLVIVAVAIAFAALIGGVHLLRVHGSPPPLPSAVVSARAFGAPSSLEAARDALGFDLRLPTIDGLESPDHVYLAPDRPTGGSTALVYLDRPDYPADASGIGLVITEFRAHIEPEVFDKLIHGGTRVEPTTVNGLPAYWIAGGRHYLFYRDATGQIVDETVRLVGDTLIWEASGVTLRIEGAPSLEAARRVAGSMR